MARRRRRGRFRRHKPDMGWWVSTHDVSVLSDGSAAIEMETVFSFDDINSDPALITQDKSDWFIKRVLVDVFPTLGRPTSATSGPARIYELALGTMMSAQAAALVVTPDYLLTADVYEQWRRLFRSYVKPVYATWEPQSEYDTLSNNYGLLTLDGSSVVPAEATTSDSPWGPSAIADDFTVSSAGLVEDSAMYLSVSTSDVAPSARFEWNAGETLNIAAYVRVLLQKRRT